MSRKKKEIRATTTISLDIPSEYFDPQNPSREDLRTQSTTIGYLLDFLYNKGITEEMYHSVTLTIGTERFGSCPHLKIEYQKSLSPQEIAELELKAQEEEVRKSKESAERKIKKEEKKKKKEEIVSKLSKEEKEILGL